jgi:hypothetical protein
MSLLFLDDDVEDGGYRMPGFRDDDVGIANDAIVSNERSGHG